MFSILPCKDADKLSVYPEGTTLLIYKENDNIRGHIAYRRYMSALEILSLDTGVESTAEAAVSKEMLLHADALIRAVASIALGEGLLTLCTKNESLKPLFEKFGFFKNGEFFIGANYWASNAGIQMWNRWDESAVVRDLDHLSRCDVKVLRVFPLWSDFQPIEAYRNGGGNVRVISRDAVAAIDSPEAVAGIDPVMVERFVRFLDLCSERDIKIIVGLLTGWMSGRVYVPKALDGLNLYTYKELDTASIACCKCAARKVKEAIAELAEAAANEPGEWKALRFAIVPDAPNSNYNGTTYIDTMSRKATDKFIEMTHEEYAKRCGDRLGRSIKGIFTDEPHRGHCFDNRREHDGVMSCATAWTDDIFEEFETRYGFACRPILPELFYRKNGEIVAPVKLHYIDLANALFLERFAKPLNDWCNDHGIQFTGHVLHEDSLMNQTVPNGSLMRFYEYMGYPGVDVLTEHNRCYWIVKQLASAARQLGKKWLLSELYGCTGWQFDFKAHKAVGDWQALFGINLRCQHLSWYTMEGESKRDYPASILHQSPWYKDYSKVEDYFARMGLVLSEGAPACDVLLLNPIESVWCQAYAGWAQWISNVSPDVAPYERRYARLFHYLTDHQIDFDYGEEEMMSRMASVDTVDDTPVLRVGKASYKTVIVSNMLTIRPTTLALLREFMAKGGKVIFCGDAPAYVNAVKSDEPAKLAEQGITIPFDEEALEHKTMGAWAMDIFENIPAVGDCFEQDGLRVTIQQIQSNRITKMNVLVLDRSAGKNDEQKY